MIAFACPACNQRLSAGEESAGKQVVCPHCRKTFRLSVPPPVANAPGLPAAPPVPLSDTLTAPPPADAPSLPRDGPTRLHFLAPAQQPDELGRLGAYRVLKVLGSGGMGVVLLADDPALKRHVALKVMRPELAADPTARQRFLREARATAALDHPHVIPVYQVGEANGVPFLVMPLLKGETLDDRLRRDKRLPIAEAVLIGRQIADGLAVAHKHGLVHRDVKPSNVWLSDGDEPGAVATGGLVKLVDFGLARAVAGGDGHLTQTGTILGTPAFMAPEQARGEEVDCRCDLFSLGAVLYQMLTGERPFKGRDAMAILTALMTETPRPPQSLNPEVPTVLDDLVRQLLAKEPAHRPSSAKAVAEALAALAGARTLSQPALSRPPVGRKRAWALRRPVVGIAVAGVALALLALVNALPFGHRKPDVVNREQDPASREDRRPERLPKEYVNTLGMKFKLIPAGTFTMGSPRQEIERCLKEVGRRGWKRGYLPSEGPEHRVEITQPFYLAVTEVTVGQWRQFMEANAGYNVGDERWQKPGFVQRDDHPVVWVNWHNTVDFCRWLSQKEGKEYRLPTEAEWEYSCRASPAHPSPPGGAEGRTRGMRYGFGNDEVRLGDYCWYIRNSEGGTGRVGTKEPNAWGLHDMHGNVWEWCQDWYDPNYYKVSPKQDPRGPLAGADRLIRGGSWRDGPVLCRSAFRSHSVPGSRDAHLGFRVLLVVPVHGARP